MSNKSLKVIGLGVVTLIVTYIVFTLIYNSIAPTSAAFLSAQTQGAVSDIASRSQQAGLVKTISYIVYLGEIIFFGIRFQKSRNES
jgi:hypothetical protein